MQSLLDASYADAGGHVHATIPSERRLTAEQLVERVEGMRIMVVATVTADGRPLTGPVDAFVIHGAIWFSSSPSSTKVRHLRARPACSATYVDGIRTVLIAHGDVRFTDPRAHGDVFDLLLGQYPDFEEWAPTEYCVLEPRKLFAASFDTSAPT